MHVRLLRIISLAVLLFVAIPEGHGEKKNKKNSAPGIKQTQQPTSKTATPQAKPVDISQSHEPEVPIPQESSLKPELKKTPKVVIVPAPPPPPGKDPVPPYPKH